MQTTNANNAANNIDIFNESAALIFSELYKSFPVPLYLQYENMTKQLFKDDDTIDRNNHLEVFINTIAWLKTSGYIWLDSESEMEVYGVVLSQKGLEVLKITPDSSNDNISIGDRLAETNGECAAEEKSALIKQAITFGSKIL